METKTETGFKEQQRQYGQGWQMPGYGTGSIAKKDGLEIQVLDAYKSGELEAIKGHLETNHNLFEREKREVDKLLRGFSQIVIEHEGDGFYKFASGLPLVGGYFQRKLDERNGRAVERMKSRVDANLSKLEGHISKMIEDYHAGKSQLEDLFEIRSEAVTERERAEEQAGYFSNELEKLKEKTDKMDQRKRMGKEGLELEKLALEYGESLHNARMEIDNYNTAITSSTNLGGGYLTYLTGLQKTITAMASIYNRQKYNIDKLEGMNLDVTDFKKAIEMTIKSTADYATLARVSNEALVTIIKFAKSAANMHEKNSMPFFGMEYNREGQRDLQEAGSKLYGTLAKENEIAKAICYGRPKGNDNGNAAPGN
jgi:hypothetical protein